MPDDRIVTQYRTLVASWQRWLNVRRDAYSLTLYNRADAHISALADAMFDMECEYPILIRIA
jgi:hypothetical protein